MLAKLARHRKSLFTVVAVLCMLYSSSITLDLLSRVRRRGQCHQQGKSLRRMARHASDTEQSAADSESGHPNYRLDMIKADIESQQTGIEIKEYFDDIKDKTDYFGCKDLNNIPHTRREVEENLRGNRGISFLKVRINGVTIPVVMKEANRLYRTVVEEYKYNSAKREIMYLVKLRGLRGIPRLLGSCVEDLRIRYLVERVDGYTLCNDNGTTDACSSGSHVVDLIKQDPNPQLAALAFSYSVTTFFQQLEDRHLFMEDISGLNFMVSRNWQLIMVDADSLVFYNDSRIYSHVSCNADEHCPMLAGNLWVEFSLNKKIYKSCRDLSGICEDQECRGFGTELHACGLANWFICRVLKTFKQKSEVEKLSLEACNCMGKTYPHQRCTFREASKAMREALRIYIKSNGYNLQS